MDDHEGDQHASAEVAPELSPSGVVEEGAGAAVEHDASEKQSSLLLLKEVLMSRKASIGDSSVSAYYESSRFHRSTDTVGSTVAVCRAQIWIMQQHRSQLLVLELFMFLLQ